MPFATQSSMIGGNVRGDGSLIVWGDTIHMRSIQLARPEATWIYDADPAMEWSHARRLLDRVSAAKQTTHIGDGE
jgi:hypothetical protein